MQHEDFQRNRNSHVTSPDPGTVVDSVVTKAERYNFYTLPEYVNQGAAMPVCYNIIYDDTRLPPHRRHTLAYQLCHLYYILHGTAFFL
ncbi:hypothetical protein OESDEN_23763 [Oesophagostomum dentatum]|uniref:Piwi domain-containing protein n=1 Tax=Oesophagostomum dentatum TaxID=61180 RepID=A0A0B1RZH5_OESDE|nr:hypothetical protein OESDEN_23763 [Oesophagostomum dentatum]